MSSIATSSGEIEVQVIRQEIVRACACASEHIFPLGRAAVFSSDKPDTTQVVMPHDEGIKYRILYEAHDTPMVVISVERRPITL